MEGDRSSLLSRMEVPARPTARFDPFGRTEERRMETVP